MFLLVHPRIGSFFLLFRLHGRVVLRFLCTIKKKITQNIGNLNFTQEQKWGEKEGRAKCDDEKRLARRKKLQKRYMECIKRGIFC